MYLSKDKLQHINTIAHEGKVVIVATDADGKIWYSIKQDGFEDSYLNTPPDERTGWESWQELEFPNEDDDQSVIDQETAELTDAANPSSFVLRSRYKTFDQTAVAPVQLLSALGHVYVFRQSQTNTLLVDRFVLDGMTNKLNRKLEVRFKRSRQKHEASKNMKKGASGLVNIDTLDFRDINGNFFYEPTTELSLVNNLQNGWFSIVLVPTIENDVHRWHIFAYNSQSKKVELTTLLMSEEGLFDVQDYTVFEESNDNLIPRSLPGIIKRTLDLGNVTVVNGLAATKYDVQREQQTDDGMQLLRESTKVMLAIPTNTGNVAAFSFAVAGDGTLSQIAPTATEKIWRNTARQVLLPLNTLDNVKIIGTTTPPPQGQITRLEQGEEDAVNVVSSTVTNLDPTKINQVKISGTRNYNSFQQGITKIDNDVFEVTPPTPVLGNWEVIPEEQTGLVFNGAVIGCEITPTGKLRITAFNHGLNTGESVQIVDTRDYNGTYTVTKIDDKTFSLDDIKWQTGTAVNLKMESLKRRGLVFDGGDDKVQIPPESMPVGNQITVTFWAKGGNSLPNYNSLIYATGANNERVLNIHFPWINGTVYFDCGADASGFDRIDKAAQPTDYKGQWVHWAFTKNATTGEMKVYRNGTLWHSGTAYKRPLPKTVSLVLGGGYEGTVSELCIWKVARTEAQIRDTMYLQLTGKEVGLMGYWRLGAVVEDGEDRQVLDFSVNGNDAIVYGGAYVSAVSLSRNLTGTTTPAIKYENEELFAVSEGATYAEDFEFKVNPAVDPNNVDGQNNKIFAITYKGKNNRSSLDWINITPNATEFINLGNGWYQAKCRFVIPDGVSLVRSFGIGNLKGSWTTLDIRKQTIQLISDVITEARYTDTVSLTTLADNQLSLEGKVPMLRVKEQQEGTLLVEKRDIESKLAVILAQEQISSTQLPTLISAKKTEISNQQALISSLQSQLSQCQTKYNAEVGNLFNYWCKFISRMWLNEEWTAHFDPYTEIMAGNSNISGKYIDFKFEPADSGYYRIVSSYGNRTLKIPVQGEPIKADLNADPNSPIYHWKFEQIPENFWLIRTRQDNNMVVDFYNGHSDRRIGIWPNGGVSNQQWKIVNLGRVSNNNIANAKQALDNKTIELQRAQEKLIQLQNELKILETPSTDLAAQKTQLQNRLQQVNALLTSVQTEINTLNTDFLNGVRTIQQTPQTMPQIAKDGKGLVTQGALLGFVRPASGLNAIETCEGNVQLSYFDKQGRMRRTNYDATADSLNTAFEQWIPNTLRPCLNFSNDNSIVKLNQPLSLTADWSIEAWFCYPLPQTAKWNTLIRGQNADQHIVVSKDKKLGIYLTDDPLKQYFYDCGFSMGALSTGWHHLTVVGERNTTRFYIDGKEVGDTKAKALVDAQVDLSSDPNNATFKQKLEDIKQASLKPIGDVYAIGNNHLIASSQPPDYGVMKFDGVNDHIKTTARMPSGNEITIEYWFKGSSLQSAVRQQEGGSAFIVAGWQGLHIISTDGGTTGIKVGDAATNGSWHHIAMTWKANTVNGFVSYLDGVLVAQRTSANVALPTFSASQFIFLASIWGTGEFTNGQLTEVRIWNKARTQAEIQADMRKRLTGKEANLVAYYPLNKVESGKVLDLVAGNHGTVFEAINVTDQTLALTPVPVMQGEQFGKVAEVRIWGMALSDEEIEANSRTLISGNESGLLAYYPLNEATGTDIRDNSGNGQHGTLTNALWWACVAPMGQPSSDTPNNQVMKFDGVNDHITLPAMNIDYSQGLSLEVWVRYNSFKNWSRIIDFGNGAPADNIVLANPGTSNTLGFYVNRGTAQQNIQVPNFLEAGKWMHIAVTLEPSGSCKIYKNGQLIQSGTCQTPNNVNRTLNYIGRSNWAVDAYFDGQMAEFRLWNKARTEAEIKGNLNKRLTGQESGLAIYLPLDGILTNKVLDYTGINDGTVTEATIVEDITAPWLSIGSSVVSAEYSTITIDQTTGQRTAMMRRLFASPTLNGVNLFPDKPLETLELKWIGNAQFAPTLLGYIEGAPPVPTENLTLADDYNGATSVELTMTEDVEFNWTRSQDSGLGAAAEIFYGAADEITIGAGYAVTVSDRRGFKGNFEFSYQFQNESSITSSSSLSMTDKLELRGTFEDDPKFPHLGNRFIPKNIGYALVVSALADVFVTRLARSKKMVGYQTLPVDGIPPDVNTITFLMNPAYTMNGSLDGMTGSSATSQRFFKHVPEMRSQYGSLYPASYYRLQEAYNLKRQIEADDKRRESYFNNFNVRTIDEISLDRNINSGDAPTTIGVQREEDKPTTVATAEEQTAKAEEFQAQSAAASQETSAAAKAKQAEIQSKITDQDKQVHAMASFDGWQRNMENIQIRAGKRNIVNTYVWDADGGLRTEAQSFANTVEHTIGGSYTMAAGLGTEFEFELGFAAELTAQATVNLTQTMSKTEARSRGFELNIDLSGMENKGVTDYNDNPILPGEKVDRYRFMSFYLEGSTQNFQDFFNYVVDPEWLRSNDEEARALRQAQAGKPNKAWRVLHRVTYVERPALMGFGRDVRQFKVRDENVGIGKVIVDVASLQQKVDQILEWISSQQQ
ncbi:LamG-like jellyroll fold domain-containing protein [Aerosakkonema funiforme]|uniref:LamG-like jellyroll fold domain-containing protein n=1 Tax=Aerosakkonema funiforme TaxID=1246630 RepID=UPI0035B9DE9A